MTKQCLCLLLSLLLCLVGLNTHAQVSDESTGFFVMPGIVCKPFSFSKGYSVTTSYSVMFGSYRFPVKGVVKFGFPRYDAPVKSPHKVDYNIKGSYIQPGLMVFKRLSDDENELVYLGLLGYIGKYNHDLTIEVTDNVWGTNQLTFSDETDVYGFTFEFGGVITIYRGLKLISSLSFGGANYPENPLPQIQNFIDKGVIMPGMGKGSGGAFFAFNVGLGYVID